MNDDFNFQELDTSWIHDFEKEDCLYKDFYLEDLYFINMYYVYLNESDTIEKVKKDKYFFNEFNKNILSKEELFKLIVNKKNQSNENYKLNCLFKYNCTVDPCNIITFLKNNTNDSYLSPITSIENVQFKKTIMMFHDLNSIYVIYKKTFNTTTNTKTINTTNNITKRLHIRQHNKKTRRLYI
uniref:Uncharacterized protein n=1 Tax=viral metagenome TaxID=1070528 RepID=A0A6C0E320_9ZZZZ